MSLIATFLLAAAVVTLLVATEALDPDFLPEGSAESPSDAWFYAQLKGLADFSGGDQAIAIAVTIVVGVSMLGVLLFELWPLRRREALLPISSTSAGALTIEASSVRLLAERTGFSNRNISSLRCRVRRRSGARVPASIVVACYPRVILGSNVQEVRDDLQSRIKHTVEDLTGLTVLQVHVVKVKYDRSDTTRLLGS